MSKSTAKSSTSTHQTVQKSSTLSRKYVRKPQIQKSEETIKISRIAKSETDEILRRQARAKQIHAQKVAEMKQRKRAAEAKSVKSAKNSTTKSAAKISSAKKARQAKDRAIRQALKSSATINEQPEFKPKRTLRKVLLAITCSAASVAALALFVQFSMPDITVRVAALQSGIEASYPAYIPRNYSLNNVVSDTNSITMYFVSGDNSFELNEESSTWDSTALLNNYVKSTFSKEYVTLREQGITIYVDEGNAAWVNGGVLYKITCAGSPLTKEQIRNLATSL